MSHDVPPAVAVVTPDSRSDSYHRLLRRFYDTRHDYDTPRTLARARRLVNLYPPVPRRPGDRLRHRHGNRGPGSHYVQACGGILEGTTGGEAMPTRTVAAESTTNAEGGAVILVRIFAGLREQAGWDERQVSLRPDEPSPTPASLWRRLALGAGTAESAAGGIGALPPTIRVAVNQAFASPDAVLSPGDEVAFLPPTSGG